MSQVIVWDAPTTLTTVNTYTISVYRAETEDGDYSSIASGVTARDSAGAWVDTYTDPNGSANYFYYVKYSANGGAEGNPVLAVLQPTIKEQRLIKEFKEEIPALIARGLDSHDRQILSALRHALQAINSMAPVTAYSITNMPSQYEPAVRLGAVVFFYATRYLNVAIRDFGYGVGGLSLNIDRGAKINQALRNALDVFNQFAKSVKYVDYPDALGAGSYAFASPSGRVMGFLIGTGSIS